MLIEIILKGLFHTLKLSFLSKFLLNAKDTRFNYPVEVKANNLEEVIKIFEDNEYVDFVINTDNLIINEKVIPKVFINLTKDKNNIELVIYFDLYDFNNINNKTAIDNLIYWTDLFQKNYNFYYYVCQMDNADDKEYYFDINGKGPLYDEISL